MRIHDSPALDAVRFGSDGLVPVIAQDALTGEVLMMAWSNREALELTLRDGRLWYWSRSRQELWQKGATSGNHQDLVSLHADCDHDAILALVVSAGPACHTGANSCFEAVPALRELGDVIRSRQVEGDDSSYTKRLLADENLRLKKLGEEAVEVALACRTGDHRAVAAEAADLLYHLLVACAAVGVDDSAILAELARRRALGGNP